MSPRPEADALDALVRQFSERSSFVRELIQNALDAGAGRIAYRVHDGVAERTSIIAGSTSVERIEILDGLAEGDLIVLSSTSSFDNAERVLLNQ